MQQVRVLDFTRFNSDRGVLQDIDEGTAAEKCKKEPKKAGLEMEQRFIFATDDMWTAWANLLLVLTGVADANRVHVEKELTGAEIEFKMLAAKKKQDWHTMTTAGLNKLRRDIWRRRRVRNEKRCFENDWRERGRWKCFEKLRGTVQVLEVYQAGQCGGAGVVEEYIVKLLLSACVVLYTVFLQSSRTPPSALHQLTLLCLATRL